MNKLLLSVLSLTTLSFAQVDLASCKACHGVDYEKAALGMSKIVRDMTKAEVSAAMVGYKNGTYGSTMKGVMHTNVKDYSFEELISTNIGLDDHTKTQNEPIQSSIDLVSCKACHGVDFEKAALGMSKIVRDMTKAEVSAAMVGYKNGTYGGAMKGVMHTNVKDYSFEELISTNIGLDNHTRTQNEILNSSIELASCQACHGHNFEKAALGSSKIVNDMTKEEVTQALLGYKNGTYGRNMKGLMTDKVKMYTLEELKHTQIGK